MTQFIEPNKKSDLSGPGVLTWLQSLRSGLLNGFEVTHVPGTYNINIASGRVVIDGTTIHDDETRLAIAGMITAPTGANNDHWLVYLTYTYQDTFPPAAMTITAIRTSAVGVPASPVLPVDSIKIADIFVPNGAANLNTAMIVNAPKLPARGNADGEVLLERLINANANVLVSGGGGFTYNGTDALTWSAPIKIVSQTITHRERYMTAATVHATIAAATLGPATVVGPNSLLFAVMDRRAPVAHGSPVPLTLRVLNLDAPDATEAAAFFDPESRDKIIFVGALNAGVLTLRGGIASLPTPTTEPPARFLRMEPGGAHFWGVITSDMVQAILSIASFSASTGAVEVGTVVATPAFTASYANGPAAAASLTKDLLGTPVVQALTMPATAFTATPGSYQKLATNELVRFRLTADAGATPDTEDTDISWQRFFYFGKDAASAPALDESFIRVAAAGPHPGLDTAPGGKVLRSGRGHTFAMTGMVNEYVYFAYADSHGALVGLRDNVAGFDIGFVLVGTVVSVATENGAGAAVPFRVYRSTFPQTGSINFTTR
jgi:hypothetical protein